MTMTRSGITTTPAPLTIEEERNKTWAQLKAEAEAKERVTYLAYDVPFGDAKALAHAQVTRRPHTVPVRMPGGLLEHFYPAVAVMAIMNGGRLEISEEAAREPIAQDVAGSNRPSVQRKPSRA